MNKRYDIRSTYLYQHVIIRFPRFNITENYWRYFPHHGTVMGQMKLLVFWWMTRNSGWLDWIRLLLVRTLRRLQQLSLQSLWVQTNWSPRNLQHDHDLQKVQLFKKRIFAFQDNTLLVFEIWYFTSNWSFLWQVMANQKALEDLITIDIF